MKVTTDTDRGMLEERVSEHLCFFHFWRFLASALDKRVRSLPAEKNYFIGLQLSSTWFGKLATTPSLGNLSLFTSRFPWQNSGKVFAKRGNIDELSPRLSGVSYFRESSTGNKSFLDICVRKLRQLPRPLPNKGHFATRMFGRVVFKSYSVFLRIG